MNKKIKFVVWLISFLLIVSGIITVAFATLGFEPAKEILVIGVLIGLIIVIILACVFIAEALCWIIME